MSTKLIYICDKCKKEWNSKESKEEIVTLSLQINIGDRHYCDELVTTQWCSTCVIAHGLKSHIYVETKKIVSEKTLTTEEKIIMLLNDLGFVQE